MSIAASTCCAFKSRSHCAMSLSDERLLAVVTFVYAITFSVYGVRKMWHAPGPVGEDVGRDHVARRVRVLGLRGVSRQMGSSGT